MSTLSVAGWIVIQTRVPTAGMQFNWQLNWTDYKNGFGGIGANFWIGLERIHLLTSAAPYRLRVEVQQSSTTAWYSAEYWSFVIGDETVSRYKLIVNGLVDAKRAFLDIRFQLDIFMRKYHEFLIGNRLLFVVILFV
jgi:Fibrinogen beta and gamma chains, C-terminal globular domain